MKTVFALLVLSFSSAATAACYQILLPSNEVVWQGRRPPIAMDTLSLNEEVRKIVPNGHLIVVDNWMAPCPAFDNTAAGRAAQRRAEGQASGK